MAGSGRGRGAASSIGQASDRQAENARIAAGLQEKQDKSALQKIHDQARAARDADRERAKAERQKLAERYFSDVVKAQAGSRDVAYKLHTLQEHVRKAPAGVITPRVVEHAPGRTRAHARVRALLSSCDIRAAGAIPGGILDQCVTESQNSPAQARASRNLSALFAAPFLSWESRTAVDGTGQGGRGGMTQGWYLPPPSGLKNS